MYTRLLIGVILTLSLRLPAVGGGKRDVILTGAGATFPQPLYQHWIKQYRRTAGVRITYESIGSSGGIRQLVARKVDFGATDAFLSDEELKQHQPAILHIPTCLGAVAVIYNLPEDPALRLTPAAIAGIFLGRITNWSDRRIARANPGKKLPDLDITVIHRSDGSGTTFVFTDYLSKVNSVWKEQIGRGKRVRWPVGLGLEGNRLVARQAKKIAGSIAYVSLEYASRNRYGHNIQLAC